MARTKPKKPYYEEQPNRPSEPRGDQILYRELIRGVFPETVMVFQFEGNSVIVVPERYNDRDSPNAMWHQEQPEVVQALLRTSIAYEEIDESHPHLLHFQSRDPWTGFPIFTRPDGPGLEKFLDDKDNKLAMYPPELSGEFVRLDPKFQPLVFRWCLHLLSALKFIHSHGVLYGSIDNRSAWLTSDLSLLLVGFMDADFHDNNGWWARSSVPNVSIKSDIYAWALFAYRLLTNNSHHFWPEIHYFPLEGEPSSMPDDFPAGKVLRNCYTQQYENVDQVWIDFKEAMKSQGYELQGDQLKDFDLAILMGDLNIKDN
jgi:hypothetical protein